MERIETEFIDTKEWVPVHTLPGFECAIEYYVNRAGLVKSTKYTKDRILKYKWHKEGYPMVTLTQRLGKKKPLYVCVHKLVALAFLGPPPTPYGATKGCTMVDHIDEDKTNCHASNLRWVSRRENNTKRNYRRSGPKRKCHLKNKPTKIEKGITTNQDG